MVAEAVVEVHRQQDEVAEVAVEELLSTVYIAQMPYRLLWQLR